MAWVVSFWTEQVGEGQADLAISVVKEFLAAISISQITSDGQATAFEGLGLMATYGVLAVFTLHE